MENSNTTMSYHLETTGAPLLTIILAAGSAAGNFLSLEGTASHLLPIVQLVAALVAIAVGLRVLFKRESTPPRRHK